MRTGYRQQCLILWTSLCSVIAITGVISSSSFSLCPQSKNSLHISRFGFSFSKFDKSITFDVAGQSFSTASVMAQINVTAYGIDAYSKTFDPCLPQYNISQLCPVPIGSFAANGNVAVPDALLDDIPSIAFQIPDLEGTVTMNLLSSEGESITCVESPVGNGRTLATKSLRVASGAVAASTLFISGAAAVAASFSPMAMSSGIAGGSASGIATSPSIGDVLLWFQALSMNGMLSITQPKLLRSFYTNFGWAMGLITCNNLQIHIDIFRNNTGGDLQASSTSSLDYMSMSSSVSSDNASLASDTNTLQKRNERLYNITTSNYTGVQVIKQKDGIEAFVEQLRIPSRNTFTTILIVSSVFVVGIAFLTVVLKAVLDLWTKLGTLPRKLQEHYAEYWTFVTRLLLKILLLIYGTWCIICLYQFSYGDSWAATLLAATTFSLFSMIIAYYSVRISKLAWRSQRISEDGVKLLYSQRSYRRRYGMFYDEFKVEYWWFFLLCTFYSVVKALFIAFGNGHAFIQVVGCLVLELVFFAILIRTRAYDGRRANVLNIMISIVRLLSLVITLLFVDILGLKDTTKTVLSMVVIIVQTSLTVLLSVLVALNGLLPLFIRKKKKITPQGEERTSDEVVPLESPLFSAELETTTSHRTDSSSRRQKSSLSTLSSVLALQSKQDQASFEVNRL